MMAKRLTTEDIIARAMPEKELMQNIMALARATGWNVRHMRDSRGQNVEYLPDLILWHPGQRRFLWIEVKRSEQKGGKLTPGQATLIQEFLVCGQAVALIRPEDWLDGTVQDILRVRQ